MRWTVAVMAGLLLGGCGTDCSCGSPPEDRVLDVHFDGGVAAGVLTVCSDGCVSTEHLGGPLASVETDRFEDGWQERAVRVTVVAADGDVLAEFESEPPALRDSCCGPVWTVEEPRR